MPSMQHLCLAGTGQKVPAAQGVIGTIQQRKRHQVTALKTTSGDQATQLGSPQPSRTCWLPLTVEMIVGISGGGPVRTAPSYIKRSEPTWAGDNDKGSEGC